MFIARHSRSAWFPLAAAIPIVAGLWPVAIAGGPESYDPAAEYAPGAIVIGSDGNDYRAIDKVKGRDPVTTRDGGWRLRHVDNDVVLDVPGRFRTVPDALAFLAGARIAESAKVVISIAPGDYEHVASLALDHGEGARIVLRGAGAKPADCRLIFKGPTGMVLSGGSTITIEKLAIRQQAGRSGEVPALLVTDGSRAVLRECLVEDCRFCCFVAGGSHMNARDCVFNSDGTADCFTARNGSSAVLQNCKARPKVRDPNKTRAGFMAHLNASITCYDCVAEGWYSGFAAGWASSLQLDKCVGSGNKRGASAEYSSSLNIIDSRFDDNDEAGIFARSSTAEVIGCRMTGNRAGAMADGAAWIMFDKQPSTISDGKYGLRSTKGGRIETDVMPLFKNIDEKVCENT